MHQPSSVIFYILVTTIKSDNFRLFGVRLDPKLSWGPGGPHCTVLNLDFLSAWNRIYKLSSYLILNISLINTFHNISLMKKGD